MPDLNDIILDIRSDLVENIDEHTRQTAQGYFKEQVRFYGVKSATVNKIARQHYSRNKGLAKLEIFTVCEELFKSDYSEEAFVAAEWAYRVRDKYEKEDFNTFEHWLYNYVNNWAKCDSLCNHAIGSLIEKYPEYIDKLKEWAKDENRWVRRGATVTLVLPARKGKFLTDVFEIADILLMDEDDLVRKGYGWMLKEASRQHQREVFDYVVKHRKTMPRTALRYAIEKMPKDLRQAAMRKD